MSKQTVTLTSGTDTFLTIYSSATTWDEADYQLIDLKGWDDYTNIALNTVPKLFGNGSYVVSNYLTEREFSVKARVNQPGVLSIRQKIHTIIELLGTVKVTRAVSGLPGIESVEAHITAFEWLQETDDEVEFTITMKSTAATKTIT